ncbi:MAG: hypothetical protein KGY75_01095 [Candidatus Cloacimonetes bacterium]|nr:hypothetical protein [Candidatus Cloacimonadota bacterium]MBS3766708.1 hypothetical protein [Candidatus Cloacimonadota bacterium]
MKKFTLILFALILSGLLTFCSDSTDNSNPSGSLKYKGSWSTESGIADSVYFKIVQVGDSAKINTYTISTFNAFDSMYVTDGICYVTNGTFELDGFSARLTGQAVADTIFQGEYTVYYQFSGDSAVGNYTAYKQ